MIDQILTHNNRLVRCKRVRRIFRKTICPLNAVSAFLISGKPEQDLSLHPVNFATNDSNCNDMRFYTDWLSLEKAAVVAMYVPGTPPPSLTL